MSKKLTFPNAFGRDLFVAGRAHNPILIPGDSIRDLFIPYLEVANSLWKDHLTILKKVTKNRQGHQNVIHLAILRWWPFWAAENVALSRVVCDRQRSGIRRVTNWITTLKVSNQHLPSNDKIQKYTFSHRNASSQNRPWNVWNLENKLLLISTRYSYIHTHTHHFFYAYLFSGSMLNPPSICATFLWWESELFFFSREDLFLTGNDGKFFVSITSLYSRPLKHENTHKKRRSPIQTTRFMSVEGSIIINNYSRENSFPDWMGCRYWDQDFSWHVTWFSIQSYWMLS